MKSKLVRDKIPAIIVQNDKMPDFYVANKAEYEERLLNKMIEELEEFRDDPCIEEAADMYAVLEAICDHWQWEMAEVLEFAYTKQQNRGGFQQRFVLNMKSDNFAVEDDVTMEDWNTTPYGEHQ